MSNAPTLASRTLSLPAFRLDDLTAALEKLGKKAVKLGCAKPTYKVVATEVRDVSDTDVPYLVEFSTVEIAYEVIRKVGNWTFLAKLEAVDEVDGVPRNKVSGFNLTNDQSARYITTNMCCEHCGIKRKRNATYIVMDGSDKTLQVGSSCLRDFLGVDPAAAVSGIEYTTVINEVGEGDDWGYGGSAAPRVMPMDEFAAATLSLVSKNGFVNAQAAEFGNQVKTGNDVVTLLLDNNPKLADWRSKMAPTDEHKVQAAAVLQRLTDRILPSYRANPAALDQFSFKFGILLNKGFVGVKDAQLAAAAIYFESGKVAKENTKGGSVKRNELMPDAVEGQRLEFVGTIQSVKEVFSTFGTSLLVTFVSESGHIVKTFYSGRNESFNTGAKVNVKGTVKKLEVSEKWGSSVMISRAKIVA